MNKSTFVGIFIGIVGLMLFIALFGSSSNASDIAKPSVLSAEIDTYDFGAVPIGGGLVQHSYLVRNDTSLPVVISKMYTSCMCTLATLSIGDRVFGPYGMPGHGSIPTIGVALEPGSEVSVEVVFDPAAHGPAGIGPVGRVVSIEDGLGGRVELKFNALVTP